MQFTVAKDANSLQEALLALAKAGKRIALVPTMGALHDGHISLIELAKQHADVVVVTLFVNPTQFGPNEDFAKYPRMLAQDLEKIKQAGAAIAYTPSVEDIYPPGFSSSISVGPLSKMLEGAARPGHFDGVATIVAKLFLRILPHVAIFGEKDYQQCCVIKRLVADLDLPIDIITAPTLRESDGLAMSSRNAYLSAQERQLAPKIHETLNHVAHAITQAAPITSALEQGVAALNQAGFAVDYLELRTAESLEPLNHFTPPARLLVATKLGNTRLIDNIAME